MLHSFNISDQGKAHYESAETEVVATIYILVLLLFSKACCSCLDFLHFQIQFRFFPHLFSLVTCIQFALCVCVSARTT